ncbi:MAG: 2-oxoacid:acceptor oxidoreductase subunit alpha, partial [Desulfotomaculum sp.]|nr:2-oxoacid:acceptor oxidoreductase subunit alpha [Desulfotomaculum sp.]
VQAHLQRLEDKILIHREEIADCEMIGTGDSEIVIIAYGATARSAAHAMNKTRGEGYKVGLFRPISIWPFPENYLRKLVQQNIKFIVPEMNFGQLTLEVERIVAGICPVYRLNQVNGQLIKPDTIVKMIREVA